MPINFDEQLKKLSVDRTLTPEFYEVVFRLVEKSLPSMRKADVIEEDVPESLAADFILALADEEVSGVIAKESDLVREFRRWLTRRNDPQGSEVWAVVSQGLLELEQSGEVKRARAGRERNNSNSTIWFLPQHEGRAGNLAQLDGVSPKLVFPRISAKAEMDRVINPTEAKAAVLALLNLVGGGMAMIALVEHIKALLPLLEIKVRLDAVIPGQDGEGVDFHDVVESRQVLNDYNVAIGDQSNHSFMIIWREVAGIRRGRKQVVEGVKILCCYIIPKEVYGADRVLDEFGPTSTVNDVVRDVKAIMKRNLPGYSRKSVFDEWVDAQVVRSIFERIMEQCSENGYCMAFSDCGPRDQ